MSAILVLLGVILLIVGLISLATNIFLPREDEVKDTVSSGGRITQVTVKAFPLNKIISFTASKIMIAFSIILFLFANSLMYVKPGHQYYVVSPFGAKSTWFESGWKVIMPLSRVQEWEKWIDIKVISRDEAGNPLSPTEGVDGLIQDKVLFTATINGEEVQVPYYGIGITFNDKVRAVVSLSCRFQLPSDPESFIRLAEEFRHPLNLVNNTLIPTVKEQVGNTGWMFSAEDYTSGDASNFRNFIDDQLKNGGFMVNKTEKSDTIFNIIGVDPDLKSTKRTIAEIKNYYEVEIVEKNGVPVRMEHDIKKNNIGVSQVIVDDVEVEPKFRQKLEAQRDIAAQKGIEVMKTNLAKDAQSRILAEGERDKAEERVKQEKDQVSKLIAIETAVKEEESKRQLAIIALETSKLTAAKVKVDADAKAYEIQKADGLSEELKKRLEIEKETKIGVAKALAGENGLKLPTTTITGAGGASGQSSDITTLLLLKLLGESDKK